MRGMLTPKMPAIDDPEGSRVPAGLSAVVDGHVHVFPRDYFSAIWRWFDENAWPIRYRLSTSEIFDFLLSRGVGRIVALQYAHRAGIARKLNRYMVDQCRPYAGRVLGMATVFPGEEDAAEILDEAFDSGLGGVKLHAHVQCFDMNAAEMDPIYALCQSRGKPMVMHVGREPKSSAYRCDPYEFCRADKLERVLKNFPDLKICVPHLGFDELSGYRRLIEKYDHLWLDTTMVLTDYFPESREVDLGKYRLDRVFYGSDFPNIPYAWDRELKRLKGLGLSEEDLDQILNRSAVHFFNLAI